MITRLQKTMFLLWLFTVASTFLFSENNDLENRKPRICELIPDTWIEYPAVEPAIPLDYVLESIDRTGYALWGKEKDVKAIARVASPEEELVPGSGVFALRLTTVTQTGPDTFSSDEKDLRSYLSSIHAADVEISKTKWGEYPVFSYTATICEGFRARAAWVGLNSPNGWVVFVRLIPSSNQHEDELLWHDFVTNTSQLSERDLIRAHGMEMHEGYTLYSRVSEGIIFFAEKRASDNTLAVMVKPGASHIEMTISGVHEGYMGTTWKNGEPCTKIVGSITEKHEKGQNIIDTVITVLTKEVDEFSFDLNKSSHEENTVIVIEKAG